MLPKAHRLTKKKDFDVVFKNGRSIKNDFLICKVLENNAKESRFGFVVSKKVSPLAVVRNKVKRQLRSAVGLLPEAFDKSKDVVILTLPGIEKKEYAEICRVVFHSFKKLQLL